MTLDNWINAFVTLFVVLDSLGNIPLFYSLLKNFGEKDRRDIIRRSVIVACGILIFFSIFGASVLNYFNIRMGDFKVASGVILLILSIKEFLAGTRMEYSPTEITVFPLATPLLAGPGSISVVIVITNRLGGFYLTLPVIIVNVIISYVILANQERIMSRLGEAMSITVARILNLIITAFAVSLIREGLVEGL